jgi:peptidoglycan/xylan/chitin deacetylase (PgdA/CDA1 family)
MKLLVLMYHRAHAERHGNAPELLDVHFAHIAASYRNVLPGEPLDDSALNVCLTFDDGYFDFYRIVLPLLRRHGLRALLAIPTQHVAERVDVAPATRLGMTSAEAFADPQHTGFCTWDEIGDMTQTGQVEIGAHGHSHVRLDSPGADLAREIGLPQSTLAARTGRAVESFVFPFGRFSPDALCVARRHYRHVFRIGGAMNRSWDATVLYRVNADGMQDAAELFSPPRLLRYRARALWNRIRRR